MTTPKPSPIAHRRDLPATPLTIADADGQAPLLLGRLVWHVGQRRRPFVAMLVTSCPCGRLHRVPWRWDWGLSPDVVSYQVLRCHDASRPAWIAIDPAHAEEAARVHAEAHEAYVRWLADAPARKAAWKAARDAEKAVRDAEPTTPPQAPGAAVAVPSSKPAAPKQPKRVAPAPTRQPLGLAGRLASRRAAQPSA